MVIYFENKIYGIKISNHNENNKINILFKIIFKKIKLNSIDNLINTIKENDIIDIYMRYSYTNEFTDNIFNYMWIRVNKEYLKNIKYYYKFDI